MKDASSWENRNGLPSKLLDRQPGQSVLLVQFDIDGALVDHHMVRPALRTPCLDRDAYQVHRDARRTHRNRAYLGEIRILDDPRAWRDLARESKALQVLRRGLYMIEVRTAGEMDP